MVPGGPEIAELHGQGKHDRVQYAKSYERGLGRVGTGGARLAGPPPAIVDSDRCGAPRLQMQDAGGQDGAKK